MTLRQGTLMLGAGITHKHLGATGFEPANLSVPNRALYQAELHPAVLRPALVSPALCTFLELQTWTGIIRNAPEGECRFHTSESEIYNLCAT